MIPDTEQVKADAIGRPHERIDGIDKASGRVRYAADIGQEGCLHAALCVSTEAHATILSIDITAALAAPGVRAVLTGRDCDVLTGSQIQDMPVLARNVVRYCGEPVALVVANERWQALAAAGKVKVQYAPLPVINDVNQALAGDSVRIHPNLADYKHTAGGVFSEPGSNVPNHIKIRKGDMSVGWRQSEVVVEGHFTMPQAAHSYMETRCASAEIKGDGTAMIVTSSQAPHDSREQMAEYFKLAEGSVVIQTPMVGGGYGGKVNSHPEILAYLASRAVGGRKVSLVFTREQSFLTCGCKIGADCTLRLGARRDGKIVAMEASYRVDTGAYADTGPRMTAAIAHSSGEPYAIEHICCDAYCVYTNHIYATSFRGFGHEVPVFCMERMVDKLAAALGMDPAQLRRVNLAHPGDTTPTQAVLTLSSAGNPQACLDKALEMIRWSEGACLPIGGDKVRAKGLACFSKTSSSPTDASGGAVVMFCADGCVNLSCGAVECGQGVYTVMRQLLAQRLRMDPSRVFINDQVDSRTSPEHWKTVASMTTYLVGNAVMQATDDAIRQLKSIASVVLRCREQDLDVGEERVYLIRDPSIFVDVKTVVSGIKFENGNAYGGRIVGSGSYVMEHLTEPDKETGRGRPGPYWTCGVQAVEIEYDRKECTYRILHAVTAVDAGKVINPELAKGQITGAMNMGLSVASREGFVYNGRAQLQNSSLRTYKVVHFAENPRYDVQFIETPNLGGPYGARGLGEHGVLGMAPALANALSAASGRQADSLPLKYETVWKLQAGG